MAREPGPVTGGKIGEVRGPAYWLASYPTEHIHRTHPITKGPIMQTYLAPYVHYPTNCAAEAFTAYGKVFGVEPTILRGKDMPAGAAPEGGDDLVVHAQLKTDAFTLYGSDDCMGTRTPMQGFEVCIFADDSEQARTWFEQLAAEGAEVHVPLQQQPWGSTYGQFTDRFGLTWAFNLDA